MTEPENPFGRDHWPPSIDHPGEYEGGEAAVIGWESVDGRERKKAIAAWIDALPTMQAVRRLNIWAKVPQEVFDAACAISGLEVLVIKWSNITRLDAVSRLSRLQSLYLGSATQVESIESLAQLASLRWLELGQLKRVQDFSPLVRLTGLRKLGITGSIWGRQGISSLDPFAAMTWLEALWLDTSSVDSVRPLEALTQLRELGLGGRLPFEEYARLSAKLPDTQCFRFVPYIDAARMLGPTSCKKCKGPKVMLTGRGQPVLCLTCDKARIDRHVAQWEAIRAAAIAP
jgi:hypothetical protein